MAVPSLSDILHLTGVEFSSAVFQLAIAKGKAGEELEPLEKEADLLLSMYLRICKDGFVDLFYQCYSLAECVIVEDGLNKLGLHKLARQFARAKWLYVGGRTEITEDEYKEIDPFGDDERWKEFDRIGEDVLAEGSEIYLVEERLEKRIKAAYGR